MVNDVILEGPLEKMRGVIGRYPDEDTRYVFEYDEVKEVDIHMLFVRRPLRVTWYIDDEEIYSVVLNPWTGFAVHEANRVVEERP